MSVPRRSQDDVVLQSELLLPDSVSVETGLVCDPSEDCARQEFKPDTDVETVLRRHGGAALRPAQPLAGFGSVVDYDLDLSTSLRMVAEAKAEYANIPADIRKRFPTYGSFVQAVLDGRVGVREVEEAPTPPQRVIVVPDANGTPA